MSCPSDGYGYFATPQPARPPACPPPAPESAEGAIGTTGALGAAGSGPADSVFDPQTQLALRLAQVQSERNMGGQRPRRLGFFARLEIGLNLARTCWQVLVREPVLLVVPLVSLLAGALVLGGYVLVAGGPHALQEDGRFVIAVKTFPLAVALSIIGVVGQAVVVDGATCRLQSGRASLGASWRKALRRLPALAVFGLVFACQRTVTGLLRGRRLGDFVANLLDRAWDFATLLSVPVILYEGVGGLASVKRSAQLVRARWAAQLAAVGVINLAVLVVALPVLLAVGLIGFSLAPALGVVLVVVVLLATVVISSALSGILSAAMYRYAVTGEVAIGFSEADMWRMFDRSPAI